MFNLFFEYNIGYSFGFYIWNWEYFYKFGKVICYYKNIYIFIFRFWKWFSDVCCNFFLMFFSYK